MQDPEHPQNDPLLTPNPQPEQPAEAVATPQPPAPPPDRWAHVAEDLRVPWDWRDILIFLVFAAGSLIVVSTAVGPAIALILQLPPALPLRLVFYQMLWSGVVMMFLYALVRIRFATPFWQTIGFRPIASPHMSPTGAAILYIFSGIVLALVVARLSAINMPTQKMPIQQLFESRDTVLLLTFMGILIAPLLEETIFRGYLYPAIARNIGVRAGVLLVGALFGLMHYAQLAGGTWQFVLITTVGIIFTWVRARTGTVLASYLLHLGYNSILFVGFYIGTSGLKNLPGK